MISLSVACGGVVTSASGPSPGSGASDGGAPGLAGVCATDADCAGGTCVFALRDACVAQGVCYTPPVETRAYNCPNAPVVDACACDGAAVQIIESPSDDPPCGPYPKGYAPVRIANLGPCAEPLPPSAPPSPASCRTDADCASGSRCGFAESAGCSAAGACFPTSGVLCNSFSPGCACDGTEVSITCEGFPDGYASKPLQHTGACADAGPTTGG